MPAKGRIIDKLETSIQSIMATQRAADTPFSVAGFLYAISLVYAGITRFRALLYKKGICKTRELPCCVISIGNLSAGGTGKTPMTLYLCRFLTGLGYRVAVLSRGYRGGLEKTGGIVSDGKTIFYGPEQSGDEPYMLASVLPVPVVVGADRYRSGTLVLKTFDLDILVLDDAFQHLGLKRDLNLLLLDQARPWGNGCVIPRGMLREPPSAAGRCDAVILTRSDPKRSPKRLPGLENRPVFSSTHKPCIQAVLNGEKAGLDPESSLNDQVWGLKAFLVSGIADNAGFHQSCRQMGLKICAQKAYPDHYAYPPKELDRLLRDFAQSPAQVLVTTHKDYVKIKKRIPAGLPLVVLTVDLLFAPDSRSGFDAFISDFLTRCFGQIPHNPTHNRT